ncbi:MAG: ferritin-like domain-containing protein [Geminicoccaceae bacterium]|nr:ferritin-like domain-containing protein [Geminicoccaceae bacterium]
METVNATTEVEKLAKGRRNFMRGAALSGAAAVAGIAAANLGSLSDAEAAGVTDVDILNFALNLEYLEAEYYLRGAFGTGLTSSQVGGVGKLGGVTGGRKVNFLSTIWREYAQEIANDELAHVIFLRRALGGAAVARPRIDLSKSFNTLGVAAGLIKKGQTFDPFANELNFILGAFVFEDVGVTAYNGAAPLIQNKDYLGAAASILAVEAYHAGEIRTILIAAGERVARMANRISGVRDVLDGPGDMDQGPLNNEGTVNVVPRDDDGRLGLAFARTPQQVLNIVYAGGAANGFGFFPDRLNGTLR